MASASNASLTKAVTVEAISPQTVTRQFKTLLEQGLKLIAPGTAQKRPMRLLDLGYVPKFKIELFGTQFYLCRPRKNPDIRFIVAYVVPQQESSKARCAYARIFYKDLSLIWRAASHIINTKNEYWIGKGDVRTIHLADEEETITDESTTDLPFEIQSAMELINNAQKRVPFDDDAPELILRNAPEGRMEPYSDFTKLRHKAALEPSRQINRGKPIARFKKQDDPNSLYFAKGFEPDFKALLEKTTTRSRLYEGNVERYRFASVNRKIQYLFMHAKRHTWIIPPQTFETELSSFGLRVVDVFADDDLFVPGYEYHYYDDPDDPSSLVTQIPAGYAGDSPDSEETRACASAWLNALPIVRKFKRAVAGKNLKPLF